mmetsp:Transcript_129145/g.373848  ORF Transcript_129145/g.373848 Transcript_129145/m.373848 type:complete len:210 (+) Transcript_129145:271-900(+)
MPMGSQVAAVARGHIGTQAEHSNSRRKASQIRTSPLISCADMRKRWSGKYRTAKTIVVERFTPCLEGSKTPIFACEKHCQRWMPRCPAAANCSSSKDRSPSETKTSRPAAHAILQVKFPAVSTKRAVPSRPMLRMPRMGCHSTLCTRHLQWKCSKRRGSKALRTGLLSSAFALMSPLPPLMDRGNLTSKTATRPLAKPTTKASVFKAPS